MGTTTSKDIRLYDKWDFTTRQIKRQVIPTRDISDYIVPASNAQLELEKAYKLFFSQAIKAMGLALEKMQYKGEIDIKLDREDKCIQFVDQFKTILERDLIQILVQKGYVVDDLVSGTVKLKNGTETDTFHIKYALKKPLLIMGTQVPQEVPLPKDPQ